MATPKRTPLERARDRRYLTELYLRERLTQAECTERLNTREGIKYSLSRSQVSRDLRQVQREWRRTAIVNWDEKKANELARVDELEREYWDAWEKSKETARRVTQRQRGAADETVVQVYDQYGDPRYLQGVQWCIKRRCEILGLDEPKRTAARIDGEIGVHDTTTATAEQRLGGLMAVYDSLRERVDASAADRQGAEVDAPSGAAGERADE